MLHASASTKGTGSRAASRAAGAAARPAAPTKGGPGAAAASVVAAAQAAPKKTRQRLRRETRSELLERLRNPQISLHEAAVLLLVCRATVRRYADCGKLPHVRTPGGQRRFYLKDIETFSRLPGRKKRSAKPKPSA